MRAYVCACTRVVREDIRGINDTSVSRRRTSRYERNARDEFLYTYRTTRKNRGQRRGYFSRHVQGGRKFTFGGSHRRERDCSLRRARGTRRVRAGEHLYLEL